MLRLHHLPDARTAAAKLPALRHRLSRIDAAIEALQCYQRVHQRNAKLFVMPAAAKLPALRVVA